MNTLIHSSQAAWVAAAVAATWALPWAHRRLQLSKAKHPSMAGHSRWSKRMARLLPHYEFSEDQFFNADGADTALSDRRRKGFLQLAARLQAMAPKSIAATDQLKAHISDLQFISRYRVPYPFSPVVNRYLKTGYALQASSGVLLTDLDGNRYYDLAGSYGVNLFGYDFYKDCMAQAHARAGELGPVLGAYHPVVLKNVERLCALSGMDEVSFHMSGTEAVMQAVRLAKYHTGRRRIVRFCGAYHGWWGDVQPGIGNPATAHDTLTLSDMSERSLTVLRTRKDIACVLINPLQALHPNMNAPGDSALVSSKRSAQFDRQAYTEWLVQLRQVCSERGIALIIDEVFMGFRLGVGGAQQYFGVQADLVTYGKTLGGGYPVGVVCGKQQWMKRFKPERPADICFARGTFNAHPMVMAAMDAFLERLDSPQVHEWYEGLEQRWNDRARRFNDTLAAQGLPVRVANMSTVWTVTYQTPSRYNWMLQFYLRAQGLALSWVGTGRFIFSLNYTDADMDEVLQRFVRACETMQRDGWWAQPGLSNKAIGRALLAESLRAVWARLTGR